MGAGEEKRSGNDVFFFCLATVAKQNRENKLFQIQHHQTSVADISALTVQAILSQSLGGVSSRSQHQYTSVHIITHQYIRLLAKPILGGARSHTLLGDVRSPTHQYTSVHQKYHRHSSVRIRTLPSRSSDLPHQYTPVHFSTIQYTSVHISTHHVCFMELDHVCFSTHQCTSVRPTAIDCIELDNVDVHVRIRV